jgi:hypothetical protein
MSDHCEEQEMEAEALTAIFDDCLEIVHASQPFEWAIRLWPEQHSPEENHVGIKLLAKIPLDYPETSLPELDIELLKGLTEDHRQDLLTMAKEEAEANLGLPCIFAVCERLREWLAENNVKGMDDVSMYAQMMRREKEKEKETVSLRVVASWWVCGAAGIPRHSCPFFASKSYFFVRVLSFSFTMLDGCLTLE